MSAELAAAHAACEGLARSHYENFPVASRLLPAGLRPHIAAIYAFARIADDFADEPGRTPDERLRLLADWRARLHSSPVLSPHRHRTPDRKLTPVPHQAPGEVLAPDEHQPPADLVFLALHDTMARFDLPLALFDDLLDAFVQDVTTSRYATWDELLDYCRRSANPVGRLVLRLSGYRHDHLDRASDAVCTALQLTNFWQDLAIDCSRGRLYVPEAVCRQHGADLDSIGRSPMTPQWTATLADCAARTRRLFDDGRSVCDGVNGRLRYELRATWLGGVSILDRLEQVRFDVRRTRPTLGWSDALMIGWKTLLWVHR